MDRHDLDRWRPVRLPRHVDRQTACRMRLLPFLPPGTRFVSCGDSPMAWRSDDARHLCPRHTPQHLQTPRVYRPCPIHRVHDERLGTALLNLARQLRPFPPAGTLLLGQGVAVALRCHGLLRPLPHLQPQDSQGQVRRGKGHRGMLQMLLTDLDLHGPHSLLRPSCTVIHTCRVLPSQDHILRPQALQRGV